MVAGFEKKVRDILSVLLTLIMILLLAMPAYAAAKSYERPEPTKADAEKVTGTWTKQTQGTWTFSPDGGGNVGNGWFLLNSSNSSTEYKWYCFDEKGVLRTGWINDKKEPAIWYYTGETKDASEGSLMTGWVTDPKDGRKYYMDSATGVMSYGWKKIEGTWYYFGEKQYEDSAHPYGAMYVNERTPDGYYVGSTGAWITNEGSSSNGSSYTPPRPPEPETYTVSFDMQGHGQQIADQAVKEGGKAIKPEDPTAAGYTFRGWHKEADCINEWNFDRDTVTGDTILYANWEENTYYTVSFDMQEHGEPIADQYVEEGGKVIKPDDPSEEEYSFLGWYKEASCSNAWYFDRDTVTEDTTLYAKWESEACLAAGTMITMADGTRKPVETLGVGDMIKAFDHTAGKLTDSKIIDYWHYKEPKSGLMILHFTNDINIRIVAAHSFFCIEDNTYVCIDKNNADEYTGKHFYNAETGSPEELLSISSSDEKVDTFYLATEEHFNCAAEGLLNVEDGLYAVISRSFEYDEDMVIKQDRLAEDIKKYGLFTHEDFPYITEKEFAYGKFAYLKIALGKGITSERFLQLFKKYYFSDEYNTDVQ